MGEKFRKLVKVEHFANKTFTDCLLLPILWAGPIHTCTRSKRVSRISWRCEDERQWEQRYVCRADCRARLPCIQGSLKRYCRSSSTLPVGTWRRPWPILCRHCGQKHRGWPCDASYFGTLFAVSKEKRCYYMRSNLTHVWDSPCSHALPVPPHKNLRTKLSSYTVFRRCATSSLWHYVPASNKFKFWSSARLGRRHVTSSLYIWTMAALWYILWIYHLHWDQRRFTVW